MFYRCLIAFVASVVGGQKLVKAGGAGLASLLGGEFSMDTSCGGQTSMEIALGDVADNSNTMGEDLVSSLQVTLYVSLAPLHLALSVMFQFSR